MFKIFRLKYNLKQVSVKVNFVILVRNLSLSYFYVYFFHFLSLYR